LLGSASYRKAHAKATSRQLVLNLDCVGEGDVLMLFPDKRTKKDSKYMQQLKGIQGDFGTKTLCVREKGFSFYPSDQKSFPYGVGICALKHSPVGLCIGRIHTKADTVMAYTNINILRAALTTLICRTNQERSSL